MRTGIMPFSEPEGAGVLGMTERAEEPGVAFVFQKIDLISVLYAITRTSQGC